MPKEQKVKAAKPPKKTPALAMPKRPGTSWNMFFREHMERVKASGKPVVPTVEGAIAAQLWKGLSEDEKQVYQDRYKANFEQFKKETKQRLQELTPAEYKAENQRRQALRDSGKKGLPSLKDPNAPKRPLSNFFLYAKDLRESGKYAHLSLKEQSKAFADAWATLPEAQKNKYTEMNRVAMEAYKIEKAAYDAQA
ncbi:exp1-like protein [Lobosporangium transversale]|uniref:High mobility group box domain-containing protein n=1 Tax=Lobosporangium transversale TaxID=64571 RepID=A0A1Y2GTV5_9FUNG|nr:high mobility group box domain-containing protein [Lobosporangium transversale]KAF9911072.1 exp1-like protein [Lobosporangium transversale]ORZ22908.1 high mobility group box domain-containing protein [Lobosporangium transversale]|eukprot:XP_021883462.1 high mobility group box domain-containing protein [Lobosporangium transversale]